MVGAGITGVEWWCEVAGVEWLIWVGAPIPRVAVTNLVHGKQSGKDEEEYRILQLGTNNWQSHKEFAPG